MVFGRSISGVSDTIKRFVGVDTDDGDDGVDEVPTVADRTGFEGNLDGSEVIGRSPMSYVAASESVTDFMGKQTKSKLANYGIEELDPDEWYPLKVPLAMLYDMRDDYGESSMQNMGRHIPEHVEFPPDIEGVEEALRSVDQAYQHNHRGIDIGSYEFEKVSENEGKMVCENPYPCEFDQGLLRGVAEQFTDSFVDVEEVGDECRAEGGQRCTYRVTWT
ncbi:4-vinyl reductase [Halostella salina]|uniref:4-vinyl reductase n=1 Tax=Halostella salina TaxID=1547897 RepID=UPI00196A1389|nr:4-vinyl reductase [Halostella salina]